MEENIIFLDATLLKMLDINMFYFEIKNQIVCKNYKIFIITF